MNSQIKEKITNIPRIFLILPFSSVLITTLVFSYMYNNFYSNYYALMSQSIVSSKTQNFLFSKYISELSVHNKHEDVIFNGNIYSSNIDLIQNDNIILSIYKNTQQIYNDKPSWLSLLDLIYIKIYENNTIISSRPMRFLEDGNYDVSDLFTKQYCDKFRVCTKFIEDINLNDYVIFSLPHIDKDTNILTITIASPIYNNNAIIGDVQMDIHLKNITTLHLEDINYHMKDDILYINFFNLFNITKASYKHSYQLDNFVIMSVYISYIPIFIFLIVMILLHAMLSCLIYSNIKKSIINNRLVDSVVLDELTQCFNRKILTSIHLFNAFKLSEKNTIFMIDGNKIKYINDTYGHFTGDLAIKRISSILKEVFNKNDFIIRLGGDEFLVIANNIDEQSIRHRLSHIHSRLKEQPVVGNLYVSVSIGISNCSSYDLLDDMIKIADEMLYQQKSIYY